MGFLKPDITTTEAGGGAAKPLGEDFISFLTSGLQGGFGGRRSPGDQTSIIAQALNDLIGGGDIDSSGEREALQQTIQQDTARQVADLRERFTATGGSSGTPAAVAEGLFRSNVTPKLATALGGLDFRNRQQASQERLSALIPILQLFGGLSSRGIPQAFSQNIVTESPFVTGTQALAGLAQAGGSLAGGFG